MIGYSNSKMCKSWKLRRGDETVQEDCTMDSLDIWIINMYIYFYIYAVPSVSDHKCVRVVSEGRNLRVTM